MSYSIEDAETISRALAGGFEIPPAHVRADLIPGDLATLFFNVDGHLPGEPLRVEVLEIEGPGQYIGRLIEESGDLRYGTPIAFDERQVAWIEPPDRVRMSGAFDIWKSKGEEPPIPPPPPPPAPPPSPRGQFIPPEEPYQFPRYPRELERIPQESFPLPPVFYLPYRPGGMIPAAEEEERMLAEFKGEIPLSEFQGPLAPAPIKENPFAIWNPAAKLPIPAEEKAGAFAMWEQKELPLAPAGEKSGAFSIWTPPPSQAPIVAPPPEEAGMFSVWNPQAMAAEKAAYKEMDLWEIMVPKAEQGSMYQPEEKEAFDIWQPETPAPMPVAPIKPKKKKKKAEREELTEVEIQRAVAAAEQASAILDWEPPSVEWMAKRLEEVFNLPRLWNMIRKDRKHSDFIESQAEVEEGDYGIPIPIQTIVNYEMGGGETLIENLFDYFEIDPGPVQPLLEEYAQTEDEELNEQLNEISSDIQSVIHDAFETLKPDDIPGHFGITEHENFGNQEFVGYWEEPEDTLSPAERRRRQAKRDAEELKEQEKRDRLLKKMLGNWRPMTWEQAAEFLDVNYGLQNLAQKFRKAKTTKKWREGVENYGGGVYIIEDFGEDDGDLEPKVAQFLGIPMSVVDRFADEDELPGLWEAVFYPAFESFEEAWENIRPEDLPGEIEASSDESSGFALYYSEGEGYDEDEGEETEEAEEVEEEE